jgi:hypothetical protein
VGGREKSCFLFCKREIKCKLDQPAQKDWEKKREREREREINKTNKRRIHAKNLQMLTGPCYLFEAYCNPITEYLLKVFLLSSCSAKFAETQRHRERERETHTHTYTHTQGRGLRLLESKRDWRQNSRMETGMLAACCKMLEDREGIGFIVVASINPARRRWERQKETVPRRRESHSSGLSPL